MIETHCPRCGRRFIPAPQHVFVDNRGAYCKPTCWLHRNDGIEDKRKCKGQKVAQYNLDGTIIKTFDTLAEAGRSLNCAAQSISYACRHNEEYRGYKWSYVEGKDVVLCV